VNQTISDSNRSISLIDILPIIAVIAVLAAVLFPVFSKARERSDESVCLSHVRSLGVALSMYAADFDNCAPTVYNGTVPNAGIIKSEGVKWEWYVAMDPYMTSEKVFLCPARDQYFTATSWADDNSTTDPFSCYDNWNKTGTCIGYGYDDGLVSDGGLGLVEAQKQASPTDRHSLRIGRNLSEVANPAKMIAFGDSNDNPGMSIAADNILSEYDGDGTHGLRHSSGLWNFVYVDGHVGRIQMVEASDSVNGGFTVGLPKDMQDAYDWCYNRDAVGDWSDNGIGGYPVSREGETCKQLVRDLYTHSTLIP
jgi:prepilin-type processing-associated H-X9-DG protein